MVSIEMHGLRTRRQLVSKGNHKATRQGRFGGGSFSVVTRDWILAKIKNWKISHA
jgi:hypothetical protein